MLHLMVWSLSLYFFWGTDNLLSGENIEIIGDFYQYITENISDTQYKDICTPMSSHFCKAESLVNTAYLAQSMSLNTNSSIQGMLYLFSKFVFKKIIIFQREIPFHCLINQNFLKQSVLFFLFWALVKQQTSMFWFY